MSRKISPCQRYQVTKCLDGADPRILTETDLKKSGMGCSLNTVSKWSQTSVVVMVVVKLLLNTFSKWCGGDGGGG